MLRSELIMNNDLANKNNPLWGSCPGLQGWEGHSADHKRGTEQLLCSISFLGSGLGWGDMGDIGQGVQSLVLQQDGLLDLRSKV